MRKQKFLKMYKINLMDCLPKYICISKIPSSNNKTNKQSNYKYKKHEQDNFSTPQLEEGFPLL